VLGEAAARAVWKGLPAAAGIDLSGRMGYAGLTNPAQFVDFNASGKDLYKNLLMGLAGPSSSMMGNWVDAAAVAGADPAKALQMVMPKVLSDPLKALDRSDRGIISRSGQEIVPASELSAAQNTFKSFGFEATQVSDMYETRGAINAAKTRKADVRSALLRRYSEAKEAGKPTGDIMDDVAEFNRRNPRDRIQMSTLRQTIERRRDARKQLSYGARVTKRDTDVLEQVGVE
jgi:hypothetical protein